MKSKQEPNTKKRKVANDEKNDRLIKIGIVIITIIFIFIIYRIFNIVILKNEEINLSGEYYYQYFYGIRQDYSGEMEVVKNNDNIQLLLEDERKVFLDSTPIYYRDVLGKVLFTDKMELINTDIGKINRLEEFTNIVESNDRFYIKKLKKDKTTIISNNSFMYDGRDLYFFLEEMTVTIGKKKYNLSPLSYAIVNYKQNIELYDYSKDEYTIIDEELAKSEKVIATDKDKIYKINMGVDSYNTGSSDQLLIRNIDYLSEFDY